ncbi:hypothetical protein FHS10_005104 [Mucilaginibacter dorajii]|nr:hypothetical protein [Mucilaginibacter dorajii]
MWGVKPGRKNQYLQITDDINLQFIYLYKH